MAVRTNASDVKTIIQTTLSDSEVDRFIQTANRYVDDRLGSSGLSSEILEEIELYLSAHFLAMREEYGGLDRQTLGDGTDSYKGTAGTNLGWTRYGQQAMALDSTGKLRASGKLKARFSTMPRSK